MAGRKSGAADWLEEDKLTLIEGWARDGLTDKQIASNIGVAERTFSTWKKENPAIVAALKKGKAPVDYKVENALLRSALGYTVTVRKPIKVKVEKQKVGEGKIVEEHIEYMNEEVYVPPQTASQIFWLKNRLPHKWRDKPEAADTRAVDKLDEILSEIRENAFERETE